MRDIIDSILIGGLASFLPFWIWDSRADQILGVIALSVRKDGKENYFYIFGGKDERSQDLIQGITLAGVFFDEVALMPESFVNQATGRCSVKGSKFWFNCNPDGPYHWFKVNWIDKCAEKNILYLHFTMDDNLSLDEEIKARYRSMYVGVFFKRYIMGLWAAAEGIIYDMFDDARHVRDIKDFFQILINGNRYVSCDYGTQNATVFLLWNKGKDGKWYCMENITKIKTRYYRKGLRKRIRIFCNFLAMRGKHVDSTGITMTFTRALPKNLLEISQMVSNLKGIVSQKTLLAQIPFVENVDDELAAVKKESEENLKQQQEMFGLQKNDPPEEDNSDDSQQKAEEKKIDE